MTLYGKRLNKKYGLSRFAETIEHFNSMGCQLVNPPSGNHFINTLVDEIRSCLGDSISPLLFFSDGSSSKGNTRSGVGLAVTDLSGEVLLRKSFSFYTNGNNFLAEAIGVTLACMAAPSDASCLVVSDSKSVLDCIRTAKVSDRK